MSGTRASMPHIDSMKIGNQQIIRWQMHSIDLISRNVTIYESCFHINFQFVRRKFQNTLPTFSLTKMNNFISKKC